VAEPVELPTIQSCLDRCAPHFAEYCGYTFAGFPERTVVPCPPSVQGGLCFTGVRPGQTRRALRRFSGCIRQVLDQCLEDITTPGFPFPAACP
jgi:hypothetical protein